MSESTVQYISQFLVCVSEQCLQPVNICHRQYFKEIHFDIVDKKKVTHRSVAFDESMQFLNFTHLRKIESLLESRIREGLRGVKSDIDTIVQTALYSSQIFKDFFGGNQQAMGQYFYLRNIQKGHHMPLVHSFSEAFCLAMLQPDKKLVKAYRSLCEDTPQWQHLSQQFNTASGINSSALETFIQRESEYFAAYIQRLTGESKEFDINSYVEMRASSQQYFNDPTYYSPQFTTFLSEKYSKNPGQQGIFTLYEYYLNFWDYFYILVGTSTNIQSYFQQEVRFYQSYEQVIQQAGLKESFLSYRMWRLNHCVSAIFPSLKNPFFLETYIYSFIKGLIEKKLYFPEESRNYDYHTYAIYLKDYVKLIRGNPKEAFDLERYSQYITFRKVCERPQEAIKNNKEIVFDKKCFLDYIHQQFSSDSKPSIKKYRKFYQARVTQQGNKEAQFKQACQMVRQQALSNRDEQFYEIMFYNYVNQTRQEQKQPSLQDYRQFRTNVLNQVDQSYIEEMEINYLEGLRQKNIGNSQRIREDIDKQEQEVAEIMGEDNKSQESSESAGQQQDYAELMM